MLGPGVVWYVGISAFLFGIGALGVLIRRNPLIVLLSLEIMLNGANLALIAFSRAAGNGAGQIFALAVMVLITLGGTRIPRAAAGWISTASVFVAFGGAVWSFFGLRAHGSQHGV